MNAYTGRNINRDQLFDKLRVLLEENESLKGPIYTRVDAFNRVTVVTDCRIVHLNSNDLRAAKFCQRPSGLANETGISDATLYNWRGKARLEGYAVPVEGENPEQWSAAVKFAVLVETASMNEAELGFFQLPGFLASKFSVD